MLSPIFIAKEVFSTIQAQFPKLHIIEQLGDPVEISLVLPEQDCLKFTVYLNLQNRDELHFSVGHFWLEWFPCTEPVQVAAYLSAVTSFLSGNARVLERYRGTKCVSAELQVPDVLAWRTIGKWSRFSIPFPRKCTYRELQNTSLATAKGTP